MLTTENLSQIFDVPVHRIHCAVQALNLIPQAGRNRRILWTEDQIDRIEEYLEFRLFAEGAIGEC